MTVSLAVEDLQVLLRVRLQRVGHAALPPRNIRNKFLVMTHRLYVPLLKLAAGCDALDLLHLEGLRIKVKGI